MGSLMKITELLKRYKPDFLLERSPAVPEEFLGIMGYELGNLAKCIVRGTWNGNKFDYRGEVRLALSDCITQLRLLCEYYELDFDSFVRTSYIPVIGVSALFRLRRLFIAYGSVCEASIPSYGASLSVSISEIVKAMESVCECYEMDFYTCQLLGERHIEERLQEARKRYDESGEWR